METRFFKYQGTGNDFVILDNRAGAIRLSTAQIAKLCDRRFGVGADGLMLLEAVPALSPSATLRAGGAEADFRMVYFNADGRESSMCGNGGRCIAAFAKAAGIVQGSCTFAAIDGLHYARMEDTGIVHLQMSDVSGIRAGHDWALLDTGSPHYVQCVEDTDAVDVEGRGRVLRNDACFAPGGVNVNFMQRLSHTALRVRTYERGVEGETLSCGTGVTAAAIAASGAETGAFSYAIQTSGGALEVSFTKTAVDAARNVVLTGPAVEVFEGVVSL